MNDPKDFYSACNTPYFPLHNFTNMIMMGVKKGHPNKYKPTDSNCKFCRKKCKLFLKNKCFNKSSEEQKQCEYYSIA